MIYKETGGNFPKKYEIKKVSYYRHGFKIGTRFVVWCHNVGAKEYGGLVAPKFKIGDYDLQEKAKKAIDKYLIEQKTKGYK